MLLTMKTLDAIAGGKVTLVFRKWQRPTVRVGGTLKTARGVLAIERVDPVTAAAIAERDARRAGFASRADLMKELDRRKGGHLYRIQVRLAGPDPRIALRKRATLSAEEFDTLRAALNRLDHASRTGPWTIAVLSEIQRHPDLPAGELAKLLECDKARLKLNIRKLKNLGLTESRSPGYRISPRGRALLTKILKRIHAIEKKAGYVTLEEKMKELSPARHSKVGARAAEIRALVEMRGE